jgi:hypothetical protein
MEDYNKSFYTSFMTNQDYPVLIGFPFSGLDLVSCCIEIFLQTTAYPKSYFQESSKENFWGMYTNDLTNVYINRKNIFYCYREDPTPIIYNLLKKQNKEINDYNVCVTSYQYKDHKDLYFNKSKHNIIYESYANDLYNNTKDLCKLIKECFSIDDQKWWLNENQSYIEFFSSPEDFFHLQYERIAENFVEENTIIDENFIKKYRNKINDLVS